MRFMHKTLIAGATAAVLLTLGGFGMSVAQAAPEDEGMTSLVEDFAYPGAEGILAERGIELVSGNGRILLAECNGGAGLIRVRSDISLDEFCFEVTGPGHLTMRLEQVYQIRGDGENDITAEVEVDGVQQPTVDVPVNSWAQVGVAAGQNPAVLLELRSE